MSDAAWCALGLLCIGAAILILIWVCSGDMGCWFRGHRPVRAIPGGWRCSRCGMPGNSYDDFYPERLALGGCTPGERRTWAREGRQMREVDHA